MTEVQPIEVLLVTARQAAQMLNMSERHVYNLMNRGLLRSVKIGGSRRFHADELKRLAAGQ